MTPSSRQKWAALLRYAICIVAIAWIAQKTDWTELKAVWSGADRRLLVLSLLIFGPAPVLLAVRLKWLLAVHDVNLSVWEVVKVTFAGNFIINTLPVGTTGGDSVKAYYIARDTPYKHEAVMSVFFDRVIGVVSLVLMSGIVVLVQWGNPAFTRWGRVIGILFVVLFAGTTIYFSNRMRRVLRLDAIVARLPLASHLQRMDRAIFTFRHRPRRMLACLLLTVVLQLNSVLSLFLAGWALGMVGEQPIRDLPVYLGYTPICFLAGALPIGVMENVFDELFSRTAGLGTTGAAVSLSLFGRFIQLAWALPGGLIVLRSRPKPVVDVPDVTAETNRLHT